VQVIRGSGPLICHASYTAPHLSIASPEHPPSGPRPASCSVPSSHLEGDLSVEEAGGLGDLPISKVSNDLRDELDDLW
jgi:hypothetical protein